MFAPPEAIKRGPMPSEQLAELLGGKITWAKANPMIRSWAAFYIHQAARQIIGMTTTEKRRIALDKLPGTIRPQVETEIKRLWPIRNRL